MLNVRDFGALGNGVSDDTAAIQATVAAAPNHSVITLPEGAYRLCATVDCGEKSLRLHGDCAGQAGVPSLGGSFLTGTVAGPLWKVNPPSVAAGVADVGFDNRHPLGTGLAIAGHSNTVERVSIYAYIGINAGEHNFSTVIRQVQGVGLVGMPPGSIGILTGGHASVQAFDLVGWDQAVRAYGVGLDLRQGRLEVNRLGLMLGMTGTGESWIASAVAVDAITLEANDVGIVARNLVSARIGTITMQGSVNAPSHQSQKGLVVEYAQQTAFSNIVISGDYRTSAVELWAGGSSSWHGVLATNSYAGAKVWDIRAPIRSFEV